MSSPGVPAPAYDKVWVDTTKDVLKEMVVGRLKQHHPRFRGVIVSITLSSPNSFSVTMTGNENVFDDEGRAIIRTFFVNDFKNRAEYLCREYLGWEVVRVHARRCERSLRTCEWFVSCRDEPSQEQEVGISRRRPSSYLERAYAG